jgi:hypothetical protein
VPGRTELTDTELLNLGRRFQELKRAVARSLNDSGSIDDADWTLNREVMHRKAVDPIQRELFALASASVALPATSLVELRIKAEMLLEYADPGATDIVGGLTAALCRDVLAIAARSQDCAR